MITVVANEVIKSLLFNFIQFNHQNQSQARGEPTSCALIDTQNSAFNFTLFTWKNQIPISFLLCVLILKCNLISFFNIIINTREFNHPKRYIRRTTQWYFFRLDQKLVLQKVLKPTHMTRDDMRHAFSAHIKESPCLSTRSSVLSLSYKSQKDVECFTSLIQAKAKRVTSFSLLLHRQIYFSPEKRVLLI